ncbi:hypothetical protein ACVNSY_11435 [Bacillus sp. OHL2]
MTEIWSISTIYLVDALTFLLSAMLLIPIKAKEASEKKSMCHMFKVLKKGLKKSKDHPKFKAPYGY